MQWGPGCEGHCSLQLSPSSFYRDRPANSDDDDDNDDDGENSKVSQSVISEIDSLEWDDQFGIDGPLSEDIPVEYPSRVYKARTKLEVNLEDFNSYTDSEFSEASDSQSLGRNNTSNVTSEDEEANGQKVGATLSFVLSPNGRSLANKKLLSYHPIVLMTVLSIFSQGLFPLEVAYFLSLSQRVKP